MAEGEEAGGAFEIAEIIKKKFSQTYDIRVSILGHIFFNCSKHKMGTPPSFFNLDNLSS